MSTRLWSGKALVAALLLSLGTQAQVQQLTGFEVQLNDNESPYRVAPAAEHGVYLVRRTGDRSSSGLEIIMLDTAFRESWRTTLPLRRGQLVSQMAYFNKYLYVLINDPLSRRNSLQLITIGSNRSDTTRVPVYNILPVRMTQFCVTRRAALLGGYINQIPVVLFVDLHQGTSRVLPGLFNENGELDQIRTYDDDSFDVLINSWVHTRERGLWLKNYSADGNLIANTRLWTDGSKNLQSSQSVRGPRGTQLIAGVYGPRNSEYARGIYSALLLPSGESFIRYYNFSELGNFFNYMKPRRKARVKERIERRNSKGRQNRFNYRIIVRDLVESGGNYLLLGEAFFPRYRSLDPFYSPIYMSPVYYVPGMYRGGQIFDGYTYTHGLLVAFNREGSMEWDNSLAMNDVKSYDLDPFIHLNVHSNKMSLLYLFNNELKSLSIRGEHAVGDEVERPIQTSLAAPARDKRRSSTNQLKPWYREFYCASGIQYAEAGKAVFYVSKIHER